MFSRQRYRCWIATDPRLETPAAVPHFRDDEAAYRWLVDDLLEDTLQVSLGRRQQPDIRIRDLHQLQHSCWILRCDGCRSQLIDEENNQRHWPSLLHLTGACERAGWDSDLLLCPGCRHLVIPLRPYEPVYQSLAPSAG